MNSETVTNEHDKEIPNERYASPEDMQEIIELILNNNIIMKYKKMKKIKNWPQNNLETMLSSSLFDYSDAYILVSGNVTITGSGNDGAARELDERNKGVKFKDCTPCTD